MSWTANLGHTMTWKTDSPPEYTNAGLEYYTRKHKELHSQAQGLVTCDWRKIDWILLECCKGSHSAKKILDAADSGDSNPQLSEAPYYFVAKSGDVLLALGWKAQQDKREKKANRWNSFPNFSQPFFLSVFLFNSDSLRIDVLWDGDLNHLEAGITWECVRFLLGWHGDTHHFATVVYMLQLSQRLLDGPGCTVPGSHSDARVHQPRALVCDVQGSSIFMARSGRSHPTRQP